MCPSTKLWIHTGLDWLYWSWWMSSCSPGDEPMLEGNWGGGWNGWMSISTTRLRYCFEASWSSQCSSGSCRVTLPLEEAEENISVRLKNHERNRNGCCWCEPTTYILISELWNYDLQTDVLLLVNFCNCAPIVLLI